MQNENDINQILTDNAHRRDIRSYVRREGRMTPAQTRALETDNHQRLIPNGRVDPDALFTNARPLVIEIGFGMGESLVEMARLNPENNFIGIEVHRPGVGATLLQIEKLELQNIRVFCEDAVRVLEQYLPASCADRVQIFFPDPWHKKRHHKRRLIQVPFLQSLLTSLKVGGLVHIVTDWQDYAEHIQEQLALVPALTNYQDKAQASALIAARPRSKYESRALRLQHDIFNFVYEHTA